MKSVEDLYVFKKAHALVLKIYELTEKFPSHEKFGLISQIRRSAYSVPSNLIEGGNRLGSKEYRQFVGIARGSISELKYQLMLSKDLKYISSEMFEEIKKEILEISCMLMGLANSLYKKV
ncbi:four helix bundle protein [Candidatus Desantisbacteria bacterium]|nr:four helix bundle protein [Candidatus Desantisbacteria bacterium]